MAVFGQHPHQRRRTEQLGHPEALDRRMQLGRIGIRRAGGIHVRDHAGQAQGRIEQGKRREGRQVHPAGHHAEGIAQQFDLACEMAMPVDHTLGHAGRAAGEQDRGEVLATGRGQLRTGAGADALDPRQRGAAPTESGAGSDDLLRAARPAQRQARHLRQRDADEGLGLRLIQAMFQRAPIDTRIDQHRHRAGLEQREHQQEELRRGPHHHHAAVPRPMPYWPRPAAMASLRASSCA